MTVNDGDRQTVGGGWRLVGGVAVGWRRVAGGGWRAAVGRKRNKRKIKGGIREVTSEFQTR